MHISLPFFAVTRMLIIIVDASGFLDARRMGKRRIRWLPKSTCNQLSHPRNHYRTTPSIVHRPYVRRGSKLERLLPVRSGRTIPVVKEYGHGQYAARVGWLNVYIIVDLFRNCWSERRWWSAPWIRQRGPCHSRSSPSYSSSASV